MWLSLRDKNGTGLFDFNVGSSSGGRGGEGWIWTWKSTALSNLKTVMCAYIQRDSRVVFHGLAVQLKDARGHLSSSTNGWVSPPWHQSRNRLPIQARSVSK